METATEWSTWTATLTLMFVTGLTSEATGAVVVKSTFVCGWVGAGERSEFIILLGLGVVLMALCVYRSDYPLGTHQKRSDKFYDRMSHVALIGFSNLLILLGFGHPLACRHCNRGPALASRLGSLLRTLCLPTHGTLEYHSEHHRHSSACRDSGVNLL